MEAATGVLQGIITADMVSGVLDEIVGLLPVIVPVMIGSRLLFGFSRIYDLCGASPANASPAKVSIIILIQSICVTVTGESTPMNGPINEIPTAQKFMVN